jgi:hypothetical protein
MYDDPWVITTQIAVCTTPAGCKSIRIAVSAVMDGWSLFCRDVLTLCGGKLVMEKRELVIVLGRYG